MAEDMRDRDLVLPPNTYAYVLDATKGQVSVLVGPYKNSLSNTDKLVVWHPNQGFVEVNTEKAIQRFVVASEGEYVVLDNPAPDDGHPPTGTSTFAATLRTGRKVNVPGPVTFPLWPGQIAQTIPGHHLRHNQYLMTRVYDPVAAGQNQAIVAPTGGGDAETATAPEQSYTIGQLIIVQGTDVSYYIPPTGIEVVREEGGDTGVSVGAGKYVREAVTLERLEYTILLDEDGEKRYKRGPAVVFPSPTEKFVAEKGTRVFRAIELGPHSGLYIKVIAPYDGHAEGEELFITGKQTPIYFPQPEHSIITYDGHRKHNAIAIPAGEGRYVMNRDTGDIRLVRGPAMYLPDPRTEVVVLRVLDDKTVNLLYPGNVEALEVNRQYREAAAYQEQASPTSSVEGRALRRASLSNLASDTVAMASAGTATVYAGDSFSRGTQYNKPRSITLDNKYDGAVTMNIWPGYAVLITKKTGERRVEQGPALVLLEYDEVVMPLALSTGKPKTTDRLLHTAYLRTTNNQIGDIITVETRDLVSVKLTLSYRLNFEGDDPLRWFDTENYVKILTDHARSRLKNVAKRHPIQEFYTRTIDIIRDAILGVSVDGQRPGLAFAENGMRVFDVEVLSVRIEDENVGRLLLDAQTQALQGAIELSTAAERTARTTELEALRRTDMDERALTQARQDELEQAAIRRSTERRLEEIAGELQAATEQLNVQEQTLSYDRAAATQRVALERASDEVRLDALRTEVELFVQRMAAVNPTLVAALQNFGDQTFVEKLVTAIGPAAVSAGVTTADIFLQVFKGTPFEGALESLAQRPLARAGVDNGR